MEFEQIKEIIKLFDKSSLAKLNIHKDDFSLDLEKAIEQTVVSQSVKTVAPQIIVEQPVVEPVAVPVVATAPTVKAGEIITSPMVGTFYKAPSPDSPPYAAIGEIVKKGKPLAIIEAMKIMNEIEAEFDCKLLEVLADDGQPVEYDMPLFRVERV